MIDFRSDTVTKPSKEMLDSIVKARVGDDEYSEDPEVNELQEYCASLFGLEAGLFVTSGHMGNQIAISILTSPGEEVICSEGSHILNYEKAAAAQLSGVQIRHIPSDNGMFSTKNIDKVLTESEYQLPNISLLSWENTHLESCGSMLNHYSFVSISEYARKKGLNIHLDGARVWHSILGQNIDPKEIGKAVDSLTFCFSKGLGAPVGSMLLGGKDFISRARRIRKVRGGGMRQVGVLAGAARYALDTRDRLIEDHTKANTIASFFNDLDHPDVTKVLYMGTNMVFLHFDTEESTNLFLAALKQRDIKAGVIKPKIVRLVTHLDIKEEDLVKFFAIFH